MRSSSRRGGFDVVVECMVEYEQWKSENSDLSNEVLQTVEAELTKLNQSLYGEAGSSAQTWSPELAIKTVKKPKRVASKKYNSSLKKL